MLLTALLVAALNLCRLAHAGQTTSKRQTYTAKFDDLPASTLGLAPVGQYLGLEWHTFAVIPFLKGSLVGLQPKSLDNSAGYGIRGILTGGPPSLTPTDSRSTFNFKEFYFGCTLNDQQATLEVAAPCEVTVAAYRGSQKVGEQTFVYHGPMLGKLGTMERAKLGSWATRLTNIEFSTNTSLVATRIDNVKYTVRKKRGR